jgi:hypothetical protein
MLSPPLEKPKHETQTHYENTSIKLLADFARGGGLRQHRGDFEELREEA